MLFVLTQEPKKYGIQRWKLKQKRKVKRSGEKRIVESKEKFGKTRKRR
jgi:hypothetical protein